MASGAGHVDDLIPAYALGALDRNEVALVDEHVTTCDACALELAESRSTTSLLPFSVPLQTPSPDVKAALFARIAQVEQAGASLPGGPVALKVAKAPPLPASSPHGSATRRRAGFWGRSLPLITTVPLVLALGLLSAWTLVLRESAQSRADENRNLQSALTDMQGAFLGGDRSVDLTAGEDGSDAVGRISYRKTDGRTMFVVSGLADRGPGVDYDVYAITNEGNEFVHAGELGVDGRGNGMTTMWLEPPFDQYSDMCVAELGADPENDCSVLRSASSFPPTTGT